MRLNCFEKALMNNPVRAALQRYVEAGRLLTLGEAMAGGCALEIGCGQGVGVSIIQRCFKADYVYAFDFNPHMMTRAKRRHLANAGKVALWQGDAASIALPDALCDAVFDFGIIHHVPDWRKALREVFRVLKPGGRFYAEEVLDKFTQNPICRALFKHPEADRFSCAGFRTGLLQCGFQLVDMRTFGPWFAWFVADKPV